MGVYVNLSRLFERKAHQPFPHYTLATWAFFYSLAMSSEFHWTAFTAISLQGYSFAGLSGPGSKRPSPPTHYEVTAHQLTYFIFLITFYYLKLLLIGLLFILLVFLPSAHGMVDV